MKLNSFVKKLAIILIGFFFTSISTPCYGFDNTEGKISIKGKVKEATLSAGTDYRHDGTDIFHRHYDVGAGFSLPFFGEGWSVRVNYRSVYKKSDEGNWELEKRPHGQIQKIFKTSAIKWLPEIKWGIRTRQEGRFKENGTHVTRNRSRIKIKSGRKFLKVKPFISNEFFYDFDKGEYNKNRVNVGVDLPEINKTTSSIYYKLTADLDDDEWVNTSSVVLKIGF